MDEEFAQERRELYQKVLADKSSKVRLHHLPHIPAGPLKNFIDAAELNKILQNCAFHAQTFVGQKETVASRLWLVCADLFPGCMPSGSKDYRLPAKMFTELAVPESFKALVKWIFSARKAGDAIAIFDGRFRQLRRYVENQLALVDENFLTELWVIHETAPKSDFRYSARKLEFSNTNRECCLLYRPKLKKNSTAQPRSQYNQCGEESTHDNTFSGVKTRTLGECPKLTTKDKKAMLGTELDIPLSYLSQDGEDGDIAADGVPFSWLETKPVEWWSFFFSIMQCTHVFDCTVGSAAAAIGAFYHGMQYDGVCCNPLHATFATQLMDKAMLAVIADGGAGADKDFIARVLHFFGPAVDEGMRQMKAQKQVVAAEPRAAPIEGDPPGVPEESDDEAF